MPAPKPKASKAASELAAIAFRQYARVLHRYLLRRAADGSDVPNLAMEVYERFLRVKTPEAVRNPRAILFRIARFVVAEAMRLESSRAVSYDSEAMQTAGERIEVAMPDMLGEHVDAERELQRVREAMKRLSPMHQTVLWLAVHDGLSHLEVAKRTGLTPATVTLYVCEARARLRTILQTS